MKKLLSLLLPLALLLSLTACGQEAPQAPATLGQALLQDFQTRIKDSPQADLETLAQGLLDQEDLEFQGAARTRWTKPPVTSRLYWKCPLQCQPPISTP